MTDLRPRRPKRSRKLMAIVIASLLVVGGSLFLFRGAVRSVLDSITGVEYSGNGNTVIDFKVALGASGEDVARELVAKDVTKDLSSTLRHIYASNPTFFPGTYRMPTQISSDRAIEILTDPSQIVVNRVTVREGLRLSGTFKALSAGTGIALTDFEEAAKDASSFGIPKEAPSLEGYLFPATYELDPDLTAKDILELMVQRTKDQLIEDGVAKKDWHRTLTLASIVQMEARQTQDFYKVSRVFLNRIAVGMHLQSDGSTVNTTVAERNDPNRYNTYRYPGLPIGPIAGAGAIAIDAALHPASGDWLYFCAINLKTGETVFSATYAEHLKAVELWRKWMRENPGWDD
jgi:UPF0755 protein